MILEYSTAAAQSAQSAQRLTNVNPLCSPWLRGAHASNLSDILHNEPNETYPVRYVGSLFLCANFKSVADVHFRQLIVHLANG